MSGRFQRFNGGVRNALEADVGPVDDPHASCGVDPCDDDPVYRVPWPQFGGDVPYCGYHLARYREQYPEHFERVQAAVDEDLSAFATRGQGFPTFDAVPETLFDEAFVAIALLATGNALYEEDDPDETVTYIAVDRRLEEDSRTKVARGHAGEFLRAVESRLGVHEWDAEIEQALLGGELA